MSEHLPPPLVPPEVSMGSNDFFPFYFDRLRKSKWWRRASDVARSRNVMMWGEAYKSWPAGSLPDDEDELAEAAGYGMDVNAFRAHRDEIMAPWVLCSDGRWYHPTVCEVVLETWGRTSERRRQERERKADYRKRTRTHTAALAGGGSPLCPTGQADVSHGTTPLVPREIGTQDKTREDTKEPVASAPPLATVEGGKGKPVKSEPWKADPDFMALWDICTLQGRKRSACRKSWPEFLKLRKEWDGSVFARAYRAYLAQDPDVKRTGGPGLHIWLRDKFETWATADQSAAEDWTPERWAIAVQLFKETGRWGDTMGPRPDEPGCRAPKEVLVAAGFGLRVINGGAA